MYTKNLNRAKKGHLIKACKLNLKRLMHIQELIQINSTYSLSHDHVHHKTNNTKSSQVNMYINIIEHIIKTTLSPSYNIDNHV